MDIFRDPVLFQGAVEFIQVPTRRPTKLVGTSPEVFGNEYWKADTNGTIVNFTKGSEGQTLRILGDGVTVVSNNTSIKTNTGANKTLASNVVYDFTLFDNVWYELSSNAGGGGGEANTASNLGAGTGIFASKVGVDLEFKSLVAGAGISISATATEITITNTGTGAPGGSNMQLQYNNGGAFGGAQVYYNNTNQNFAIADGSGNGYFQFHTKQVVVFGQLTSSLISDLFGSGYSGTSLVIASDASRNGGSHDANIYLVSDATLPTYPVMAHQIYAGGDHGLRIAYNQVMTSTGYGNYVSTVCGIQNAFEADGGVGWDYRKPDSVTGGIYDGLPGKSFKMYPGGFGGGSPGVAANKYVSLIAGEPGRGIELMVEIAGTGSNYGARIRIEDSSVADAISLWIQSGLRNIHSFNDGAGHNVLYY